MGTRKCRSLILTLFLAAFMLILAAAAMPDRAYADGEYEGSAFISLSDDGKFVVSDGEISGVPLARIEVPLQDIAEIDLADWNLEQYSYTDFDTGEPDPDAPTLLKLYLYMLEHYYGSAGDGEALRASGAVHSFFMEHFWGHDCNLLYYVNGTYPLYYEGWGATADGIILQDGDFADVAMYTDWGFYMDGNAGFNYFASSNSEPEDGDITFEYNAVAGEPLTVQVIRGMGNVTVGANTSYSAADDLTLHYGPEIDVDDDSDLFLEDGKAEVTFDEPGEYYVWVDGGIGESTGEPCSCAAVAKVYVSESTQNRPPRLAPGVEAEISKTINPSETYSVDLNTIFKDDDNDPMTFQVSVNDAAAVAADANYEYTPDGEGEVKLVFTANDGTADSTATYTVNLTVDAGALKVAEGIKVVDKNCNIWPVYEIVDYETYDEYDQHGIYGYVHPAYKIIIPEAMDFDIVEDPETFIIANPDDETGARNCSNVGQWFDWMFETGPVNRISISKDSYKNTGVDWETFFNILGSDGEAYGYPYDEDGVYTAFEVWGAEKQRNLDEGMDAYFLFIDYDRNAKPLEDENAHELSKTEEQPATCEEDGTKAYWTCEHCGKLFSDADGKHQISSPVVIPAKGHSWRNWEVSVAPTLEEAGEMKRTCSRCEKVETKVIPHLNEAVVSVRLNDESGKPAKLYKDLYVRSDYGYNGGMKLYDDMSTVTMGDAIVAAHMAEYGDAYKGSSAAGDMDAQFIVTNDYGFPWTIKIFNSMKSSSYWLNDDFAMSGMFDVEVNDGDLVAVELYESDDWSDTYLFTDSSEYQNDEDGYVAVKLTAMLPDDNYEYHATPVEGAEIVLKGEEDNSVYRAVTDGNGIARFQPDRTGKYTAEVTEAPFGHPWLPPVAEAEVASNAHTLELAKAEAVEEIEAFAEDYEDKIEEEKLTFFLEKTARQIRNAESEDELGEIVENAKARIEELAEEKALRDAKKAAADELRALMEENKDKVLDSDKLDLAMLKAIDDVYAAEEIAEIDGIVDDAKDRVQEMIQEKEDADAAAEQAARELEEAVESALDELDSVDVEAYPEGVRDDIEDLIDDATAAVVKAKTADEVGSVMDQFKKDLGEYMTEEEILDKAKAEALDFISEIDVSDFLEEDREDVQALLDQAKEDVENAEDPAEVMDVLLTLIDDLDGFETIEEVEELKEDTLAELDEEIDISSYVEADREKAAKFVSDAKAAIEAAATSDEIYDIIDQLYKDLDTLKTVEEESDELEEARDNALLLLGKMQQENAGKVLAKDEINLELAILNAVIHVNSADTPAEIDRIVKEAADKVDGLVQAKIKADKLAAKKAAAKKLKVKGLKAKSKKAKFTVRWKKQKKASGYQLQYKLKSAKKFKNLKASLGKNKTKFVTKKLKKGKKYVFRIRTYTKISGKKVFGKWSKTKAVKCK